MPTDNNTPQFDTAQYGTSPTTASTSRCFSCNQPIAGQYYQVNGKVACDACTSRLQHEQPANSSSSFTRGLLFGIGASIAGLILYATFTIVTGFYIGYVSLAVGWMVGKAIITGSKGMGGRRFQIAAVLLTYAAVSLAEIPIALHQIPPMSLGSVLGKLIVLGLASPFLRLEAGVQGVIGLVILFVGLRIAWKITGASQASMDIHGPYSTTAAPAR